MKTLGDASGKFFMNKNNLLIPTDTIEDQARKAREDKEAEEAAKALLEAEKAKQEEINSKLETLELMPMGNRVIIMPYPVNPYRQIIKGNVLTSLDGLFKNPDSGEWDTAKQGIVCGKVIEVGPDCKYTVAGDDIYYDARTVSPIPFMGLGYLTVNELNILVVLNENLKARYNDNKR